MKKITIEKLITNDGNPRVIKQGKFKKLVKSIKEFPEMLKLRPIIVNEEMKILGGNMRYQACIEAGLKEVPVLVAKNLTAEQQREFIIKDNVGFGEWDWDILGNEWDNIELVDWGMDLWKADEIDYSPDLSPSASYPDITQEEIEKKAMELAKQMHSELSQQEAICPKCNHEFNIQI